VIHLESFVVGFAIAWSIMLWLDWWILYRTKNQRGERE
jgi:hypothetical protein